MVSSLFLHAFVSSHRLVSYSTVRTRSAGCPLVSRSIIGICDMDRSSRSACLACADSKRKCDRQLPECQRCLDRDVDCRYPQPKRQRRRQREGASHANAMSMELAWPVPQTQAELPPLDLGDWTTSLDMPLLPEEIPVYNLMQTNPLSEASLHSLLLSGGGVTAKGPWFLQDEVWAIDHINRKHHRHSNTDIKLESAIWSVRRMLQSWTTEGHNDFIHKRLYDRGMPPCVQDAFTTLSAYLTCTPVVKPAVLGIAVDRSSTLAEQQVPGDGDESEEAVRALLAHVHALFIFIFILLFDGSVGARVAGERHIPTLRRWQAKLWDTTKRFRDVQHRQHVRDYDLQQSGNTPGIKTSGADYYEVATDLWRLWVLTESVRRSHLIGGIVANIYDCMVRGWAECTGLTRFTARRGLWGAASALTWLELSSSGPPLLASPFHPELFVAQHAAGDFDDFAKAIWACTLEPDKLQSWIDGKGSN